MLLPSILAGFSMTAMSPSIWAKSSRMCLLCWTCAISRPLKRSVTFTLLPLLMNFLALFTLVLRSFVSIFGERRTSLTSMVFCFFLAFYFYQITYKFRFFYNYFSLYILLNWNKFFHISPFLRQTGQSSFTSNFIKYGNYNCPSLSHTFIKFCHILFPAVYPVEYAIWRLNPPV